MVVDATSFMIHVLIMQVPKSPIRPAERAALVVRALPLMGIAILRRTRQRPDKITIRFPNIERSLSRSPQTPSAPSVERFLQLVGRRPHQDLVKDYLMADAIDQTDKMASPGNLVDMHEITNTVTEIVWAGASAAIEVQVAIMVPQLLPFFFQFVLAFICPSLEYPSQRSAPASVSLQLYHPFPLLQFCVSQQPVIEEEISFCACSATAFMVTKGLHWRVRRIDSFLGYQGNN